MSNQSEGKPKRTTAQKPPKIYMAMAGVLEEVNPIGKGGQNTYDKYSFRSIDDVFDVMNPVMAKHGVFMTLEVLDRKEEVVPTSKGGKQFHVVLTVRYTFHTTDGSSVQCVAVGEAMDRSDKATNKALQQAFKYMLFQVFMVPLKGSVDGDTESPEIGQNKTRNAPPSGSPPDFKTTENLPF